MTKVLYVCKLPNLCELENSKQTPVMSLINAQILFLRGGRDFLLTVDKLVDASKTQEFPKKSGIQGTISYVLDYLL